MVKKSKKINQASKNNKTLKNKLTKYLCKKKDICCEEDIDKKKCIELIIKNYKNIADNMREEQNYLDYIDNDVVKFIGYRVDLKKNKDKSGVKLFDNISKLLQTNDKITENNVINLLENIPLYYLMSFLGYSFYRLSTAPKL